MKKGLSPRFAMLLTISMWGMSFVASKIVLREVSPSVLLFIRFALGTVLLLTLVRLQGGHPMPPRDAWPALLLMGFIGIFVHHMLQAFALTSTTALNAGWLIGLVPLWSALLSGLLLKERFSGLKVAGLLGGFAGALLVISRGKLSGANLKLPGTRGDFMFLLSTINWAVYSVIGHRTLKRLGSTRATAGAMLFGWLMLIPVFVYHGGWREISHLTLSGWTALLFLGLCCSGLGYLFYYGALEKIEVSRVASFLYIQPLVSLLGAMFILHEPVTSSAFVGGLLVLASVFVIQHAPAPRPAIESERSRESAAN